MARRTGPQPGGLGGSKSASSRIRVDSETRVVPSTTPEYRKRLWPRSVRAKSRLTSTGSRSEHQQHRQEDPVEVVQEEVGEAVQPEPERDLRMLEQALQHVGHVSDAPCPPLDLVVLVQVRAGVVPRLGRVAIQ